MLQKIDALSIRLNPFQKNHELMQPLSKKLICPLSDFCCCFLSKGVQFHWIHELWFCGSNELAAGNVYFYG